MLLKDVSYAHQDCIHFIKNTVKTVIMWDIIKIVCCNVFQNVMNSYDGKAEFSAAIAYYYQC